ncbi:unnamed protein product, partial [Heterosigma akashiwo]
MYIYAPTHLVQVVLGAVELAGEPVAAHQQQLAPVHVQLPPAPEVQLGHVALVALADGL